MKKLLICISVLLSVFSVAPFTPYSVFADGMIIRNTFFG